MDEQIIALLKSALSEDRREGLEMLADSDDPKALKLLAAFHKRETDPELKALAVQIGRDLKKRQTAGVAADPLDALPQDTDIYVDEPVIIDKFDVEEKRKRKRGYREEVSWGTALIDVGAYGLINGVIVFLMMLFIVISAGDIFEEAVRSEVFVGEDALIMSELANFINDLGLGFSIGYGIATAVGTIISFFIVAGVIHLAATSLLGGDGEYTGLLHHMSVPLIFSSIISGLLSGIMLVLTFSSFPDLSKLQTDPASLEQFDRLSGTLNTLSSINSLVAIVFTIWLSYAIGKAYAFGTLKGCASIIAGYVLMGVFMCGCIFTLFVIL